MNYRQLLTISLFVFITSLHWNTAIANTTAAKNTRSGMVQFVTVQTKMKTDAEKGEYTLSATNTISSANISETVSGLAINSSSDWETVTIFPIYATNFSSNTDTAGTLTATVFKNGKQKCQAVIVYKVMWNKEKAMTGETINKLQINNASISGNSAQQCSAIRFPDTGTGVGVQIDLTDPING